MRRALRGSRRLLALVIAAVAGVTLYALVSATLSLLRPSPRTASLLAPPSQIDAWVESRTIAPPPGMDGSRFVAGWRAAGSGSRRSVVAAAEVSRIEAVSLAGGPRRLVLDFDDGPLPEGVVQVRAAGGPYQSVPIATRTEVPLPAALPLGRFPIELRLPPGTPPLRAALDRAQVAGEVRVRRDGIVQGGVSLVEIVRPLRGRALVSGELEPPARPRPGQRLEVRQRCGGSDRVLWRWRPRWRDALRRPAFRIPVGCASGWLHLRLLAPAAGPAAVWHRLALDGPVSPAVARTAKERAAERSPRLVLVYVFDALRADAIGKPKAGRSATPALDALAAEGVAFEQHLAVAPSTLPSTKTLFTGRVWRRQGGVPLETGVPTLAEAFRSAGYHTGLFSGNTYVSAAFGMSRGFDVAPEETLMGEQDAAAAFNDNAALVSAAALAWIGRLPADARVFLYLHVIHPHNPYDPPAELAKQAEVAGSSIDGSTRTLLSIVHRRRRVTSADRARIAALYRANLAYADARFGALLAALRERYPPEESLVVATSDHGEELFDHGGLLHGYTLYEEQIRIPLIVSWPGAVAPRRVTGPTSTVDLHDALAGLAGGSSGPHQALGELLEPAAGGFAGEVHLASAANVRGGIFAARSPRWKVVWAPRTGRRWGVGEGLGRAHDAEMVFDLARDPRERHNLAGLVDDPEVLWLWAELESWAKESDGGVAAQAANDPETRARLRALGYVE